jgi:hypothetical protein
MANLWRNRGIKRQINTGIIFLSPRWLGQDASDRLSHPCRDGMDTADRHKNQTCNAQSNRVLNAEL